MQPRLNSAQIAPLQDLQNGNHHPPPLPPQQQINDFDPAVATSTHDDFLDQMLSSLPSWNEFTTQNGHSKLAWEMKQDVEGNEANGVSPFCFDESAMLASKLRQNQISGLSSAERMMMLQQQLVLPRSEIGQNGVGDGSLFNSSNSGLESSIQGLYNGFAESLQSGHSHQFLQSQAQNFGAQATMSQAQGISSAGGAPAQPRQRVRARRGQATDPHSIAERLRRERIAERMKGLQELVPNANKTDKASMLDEIIDYVKFLQLQVKVLSMSRLGGAAAVAPLVADMSSEGGDAIANGRNSSIAAQTADDNAMTLTEQQVAKLMEEDMGSAMQYLQGKGLCLMPISLATAISTATLQPNNNYNNGPMSPTASVLTVQSTAFGNGVNGSSSGLMP